MNNTGAENKPKQIATYSSYSERKLSVEDLIDSKWDKLILGSVFVLIITLIFVMFWSRDLLLPLISVSSAIIGAAICIYFYYKKISDKLGKIKIVRERDSHIVDLHLNFRLATMVGVFGSVLLGLSGIATYQDIKQTAVKAAIDSVNVDLKKEIKKQQKLIEELTSRSNEINEQAQKYMNESRKVIENIADATLSGKLSNVVVAYAGEGDPPLGWSVCNDTKKGNNDLSGLFGKMALSEPGGKSALRNNSKLQLSVSGREREFYIDALLIAYNNGKQAHHLKYIIYKGKGSK